MIRKRIGLILFLFMGISILRKGLAFSGRTKGSSIRMSSSRELLGPLQGEVPLLGGGRVALYFGAGWCPMARGFEPSLLAFREAATIAGKPIELIYVPSDGNENDAKASADRLDMAFLPLEKAAELKRQFRIWAGRETSQFGANRRSGVPALVVLDPQDLQEAQFLAAEAYGPKVLREWQDTPIWPTTPS